MLIVVQTIGRSFMEGRTEGWLQRIEWDLLDGEEGKDAVACCTPWVQVLIQYSGAHWYNADPTESDLKWEEAY